jgi:hypothetical protein
MRYLSLFLLLLCVMRATAEPEADDADFSEWDQFRFNDYDYEVSGGLKEVQSLLVGRETLLQSYERTDQSRIATAREAEKLWQDNLHTQKAALSLEEALVNFRFPEEPDWGKETDAEVTSTPTDVEIWGYLEAIEDNFSSHNAPLSIPPRIRIRSLSETEDGISIEIENLGDAVDALVSVADSRGTIIGTPYQLELSDWDDPRRMDFKLLSRDDKIHLLVDTDSKGYQIPLFLRKQIAKPRIVAFPLEQAAKVGESVEYTLVIEGDSDDRRRYPIKLTDLPDGIAWQLAKIIPAATPEGEVRSVAIRNVQFSSAFNRHELALQLTLGRDLPRRLIGQPISFTLSVGSVRETLSITPVGVGELTIDLPAAVQVRLGEEKRIRMSLKNIGTETVSGVEIRRVGVTYGVEIEAEGTISLAAGERREVTVTVRIAADASVGQSTVPLVVASEAGSQTAEMRLEILPKRLGVALLSGVTTPVLILLGLVVVGYGGMKVQQIRQQRAHEKVRRYDLSAPVRGDD